MDLREWIEETFGGGGESQLDESAYSLRDLQRDKERLKMQLRRLEEELAEHEERYRELLETGASSPEHESRVLAQKAYSEKKKFKIKTEQHRHTRLKLGTILSIEALREVMDRQESQDLTIDAKISQEISTQEVQNQIMDRMTQVGLDTEDVQLIEAALDIELADHAGLGSDQGVSEEVESMERLPSGAIDSGSLGEGLDIGPGSDLEGSLESKFGFGNQPPAPEIETNLNPLNSDFEDVEDPSVSWHVGRTDNDHLELDCQVGDETAIELRRFEGTVSTTWRTSYGAREALKRLEGVMNLADDATISAAWQTTDGEIKRDLLTLMNLKEETWFPEACVFLAVDGVDCELRWEDTPDVEEDFELSVSADSDSDSGPFTRAMCEAMHEEIGDDTLAELVGRSAEALEADFLVDGDDV